MMDTLTAPDHTETRLAQLPAEILAQKAEIQRLYSARNFADMPAAQQRLSRLQRELVTIRQKRR